jgi:hypothetical protein
VKGCDKKHSRYQYCAANQNLLPMKLIITREPRALVRLEFGFARILLGIQIEKAHGPPATGLGAPPVQHRTPIPHLRILIASPDLSTQAHVLSSATLIVTRVNVYREMENSVCDLARAASLAMKVFDKPGLFPFAVGQLDFMVQRFKDRYYAEEIPVGELIRTNYHPGRLASCWAARFVYQPEMKEAAAN